MKPHILNFYEDNDMPLYEVTELISTALEGRLTDVVEKVDGQNFTFTVVGEDREVRFLGKGVAKWALEIGGLNRQGLEERYNDRPNIQEVFLRAYDTLQLAMHELGAYTIQKIFQDGNVAVNSEILTSINPNVIHYEGSRICLLGQISLGGEISIRGTWDGFCEMCALATEGNEWRIIGTPYLDVNQEPVRTDRVRELNDEFHRLLQLALVTPSGTIGDLKTGMVLVSLENIPDGYLMKRVYRHTDIPKRVARRLATGDKSQISKKDIDERYWRIIQQVEREKTVIAFTLAQIEAFFQKLGAYTFDTLHFKVASADDNERVQEMRRFVKRVDEAFWNKKIVCDGGQLSKIHVATLRVGDADLFRRNLEGIVFTWKGQTRKLTGQFTAINRLRSFFEYGNARLEE